MLGDSMTDGTEALERKSDLPLAIELRRAEFAAKVYSSLGPALAVATRQMQEVRATHE